jgi:hydroxymethylpyrimidine/phosphomethylpyrimidine kinase
VTPPVALTIAGSDSGGGAGIQADLKMFAALGVFGTSAITAVTAQNTTGVRRVDIVAVEMVAAQIDAVMDDLAPAAAKTGMLAVAEIIDLVAERAESGQLPPLVVDPVMVASSGDRLLHESAEQAYLERLFPQATVVTPNLSEASVLIGEDVTSVAEMREAACALAERGPNWVVVKGGHLAGDAVDVVHEQATGRTFELHAPRVATANVHGTGCSFAAAITAGMASGLDVEPSIRAAKVTVTRAIEGAAEWRLGAGHGPIHHFVGRSIPPINQILESDPQEHP